MSVTSAQARVLDRIGLICRSDHDDALALRLVLLGEIRRHVGFDAHAWLLTDPETEVGSAPLADVPCLPELPQLIRLKYLTATNRWTGLRSGGVAVLRTPAGDRREESLLWQELLSAHGVDDVVSLVFRDRFGCWGFLDLWRTGGGPPLPASDVAFLSALAEPVTEALRRQQARTFSAHAELSDTRGPAVLVLSPTLEVRAQTRETEDYLRILVPPDADRRPIPAAAYNVAAQLLAVEAGVDAHPAMARVHLHGGVWLTLRAARMAGPGSEVEQDIAVTIEVSAPAERAAVFVRACGLSAREAELLGHLVAGADTRAVAAAMFLSENTVQDHLKSIFEKAGVRNRRSLVARVAGR